MAGAVDRNRHAYVRLGASACPAKSFVSSDGFMILPRGVDKLTARVECESWTRTEGQKARFEFPYLTIHDDGCRTDHRHDRCYVPMVITPALIVPTGTLKACSHRGATQRPKRYPTIYARTNRHKNFQRIGSRPSDHYFLSVCWSSLI